MVYKLVSINNEPTIKLSEEVKKTTIPGQKLVLRIYVEGQSTPFADVLCLEDEADQLVKS